MKKPGTDLFELIKSMSGREKGYFRRHSRAYSDKSDRTYLLLFDAIDAQDVYDEAAILAACPQILPRQLPNLKRYLDSAILTVLEKYHATDDPVHRIWKDIRQIEILLRKRLLKQATRLHRRAKRNAAKYEVFPAQLELINMERRLLMHSPFGKKLERQYHALLAEEADVLARCQSVHKYRGLMLPVTLTVRKGNAAVSGKDRAVLEAIMDDPEFTDDKQPLTFRTVNSMYFHNGAACYLLGRDDQQYVEKRVAHFETGMHFVRMEPGPYISALINLSNTYLFKGDLNGLRRTIGKLRDVRTNSPAMEINKLANYFNSALYLADATDDLEALQRVAAEYKTRVSDFEKYATPLSLLEGAINLTELFVLHKYPAEAIFWAGTILNRPQYKSHSLYSFVLAWHLIAHYERGNTYFVEYELRNLRNHLRGQADASAFVTHLVEHLHQIFRRGLDADRDRWQALYADLEAMNPAETEPRAIRMLRWVGNKAGK